MNEGQDVGKSQAYLAKNLSGDLDFKGLFLRKLMVELSIGKKVINKGGESRLGCHLPILGKYVLEQIYKLAGVEGELPKLSKGVGRSEEEIERLLNIKRYLTPAEQAINCGAKGYHCDQ